MTQFASLVHLKTLYLEDNKLFEFPVILFELLDLKSLYLSGNPFRSIPSFPSHWEGLEELFLDKCELTVGCFC